MLQVDYRYPARGAQPPVHLTWYSGMQGPSLDAKIPYEGFRDGVLFEGKKGLILGVANDHSIAWAIARALQAAGMRLAFTARPKTPAERLKWLMASQSYIGATDGPATRVAGPSAGLRSQRPGMAP